MRSDRNLGADVVAIIAEEERDLVILFEQRRRGGPVHRPAQLVLESVPVRTNRRVTAPVRTNR